MPGLQSWRATAIRQLLTLDASERDILAAQRARDPWRVWDRYTAAPRAEAGTFNPAHEIAILGGPSAAHRRTGRGARAATSSRHAALREARRAIDAMRRGDHRADMRVVLALALADPDTYATALTDTNQARRVGNDVRQAIEGARRRFDRRPVALAALARLLDVDLDRLARTLRAGV
jgi:hypothetical protein